MHWSVNEVICQRWKWWCWCNRDDVCKPRLGLSHGVQSRRKKWDLTHYEYIAAYFSKVSGLDREPLKTYLPSHPNLLGVFQFKQPSPSLPVCVFSPDQRRHIILFLFTFKWLGCVSHIPLSLVISHSFFTAITVHLASCKISFFFHWEAPSFNLWKSQKLMSATS